ncbi:MAG: hypothetical protein KatS3mg038_0503 [Candidatus Kapaibacterium sp.]|nr:MAG: hypothetical protein KatS3mg038_0503 [Candidatus Kapabacteria bacterium]
MVGELSFVLPPTRRVRGRHVRIERASVLKQRLPRNALALAVDHTLVQEGIRTALVTVVLCDDATITAINAEFLQHNWATDVVTFPLCQSPLEGEIYISVETAARQAAEYGIALRTELIRLAVHGTLHLLGYDDTTDGARTTMHARQEAYVEHVVARLRRCVQCNRRPRSSAG